MGSSDDGDDGITFNTADDPTKVVEVVELAGTYSIGVTED